MKLSELKNIKLPVMKKLITFVGGHERDYGPFIHGVDSQAQWNETNGYDPEDVFVDLIVDDEWKEVQKKVIAHIINNDDLWFDVGPKTRPRKNLKQSKINDDSVKQIIKDVAPAFIKDLGYIVRKQIKKKVSKEIPSQKMVNDTVAISVLYAMMPVNFLAYQLEKQVNET